MIRWAGWADIHFFAKKIARFTKELSAELKLSNQITAVYKYILLLYIYTCRCQREPPTIYYTLLIFCTQVMMISRPSVGQLVWWFLLQRWLAGMLDLLAGPPSEPKKRNGRKLVNGRFRSKWRVRWDGRSGYDMWSVLIPMWGGVGGG